MATLQPMAEETMCSSVEAASLNLHSRIVAQQLQQKECTIMDKQTMKLLMAGSTSLPRTKSLPAMELMSMPVADPNKPHVPPLNMRSAVLFFSKMLHSHSSSQYLFQLRLSPSMLLKHKSLEMEQLPPPSHPVEFLNLCHHFPLHHHPPIHLPLL
eukprot:MONOS_12204.1-p1 / transcript=MONOS_12204.1 / gene=MONOS_12204 / organism=Monocercomonoides_exilis_PA203 / gene_product=unspecified product / transcript_product=unspecified product / location=Mono_scaffold00659:11-473(-) / protein_length=154 / sequence_SO=supercontig / SO=protein_coding / is_pseudo=false